MNSTKPKNNRRNFPGYIASYNRFFVLNESKRHSKISFFYSTGSISDRSNNRIIEVAYTLVYVKCQEQI